MRFLRMRNLFILFAICLIFSGCQTTNNRGSSEYPTSSSSVSSTAKDIAATAQLRAKSTDTNFQTSQFEITREEAVQWIMAGDWYNKPENIFSLGESVGVVKYCPTINSNKHSKIIVNAKNWLKLAASESDGIISRNGAYLNSRKYNKILKIFNEGVIRGARDGKLLRRDYQYKTEICPLELNDDQLKGPSLRLIKQIKQ